MKRKLSDEKKTQELSGQKPLTQGGLATQQNQPQPKTAEVSEILTAASNGDLAKLRSLLDQNPALVNEFDGIFHWTPLHHAVVGSSLGVVEELIARGADLNVRAITDERVMELVLNQLTVAAMFGAIGTRTNINIGLDYNLGDTPLELSVDRGNSAAELLLSKGIDVNDKAFLRWPLLHRAIQKHHWDLAQRLINRGADVNAVFKGKTPLHLVAEYGDLATAQLLLPRGPRSMPRMKKARRPELWRGTTVTKRWTSCSSSTTENEFLVTDRRPRVYPVFLRKRSVVKQV